MSTAEHYLFCTHESSHACASFFLGYTFDEVRAPRDGANGMVTGIKILENWNHDSPMRQKYDALKIMVAGYVGEGILTGRQDHFLESHHDLVNVNLIMNDCGKRGSDAFRLYKILCDEIYSELKAHWNIVSGVADALFEKEILTFDDVDRIINHYISIHKKFLNLKHHNICY